MERHSMAARKYQILAFFILSILFQNAKTTRAQSGGSSGNNLALLAASMQPGTFALLNQDGDGSGYGQNLVDGLTPTGEGVGTVFAYAQKAAYDPVSDKVYFKGAPHGGQPETITYDVVTNRWTNTGLLT